jgi:replicative DNA helicase
MADMLGNYVDTIQNRLDGKIKPIATGFTDLDRRLDGGLERGTLTVVAARPGMGKTAMGLCLARNVSVWGCSLFLSMEMSKDQVNDRNIAALGHLPIAWLMTAAFAKAQELNIYIDDETGLNMIDIRNKSRSVKRKAGLDLLVIDQLSFITGGESDKSWEVVGEYTRSLLRLAKELDIAVVLLCQLNRKCEERNNKRPQLSDLAVSGSIEQDAANVIFLYRDEIYNPDSKEKGVCEVITAKQRQGEPGIVGLTYIGNQTRFEDKVNWMPQEYEEKSKARGFT